MKHISTFSSKKHWLQSIPYPLIGFAIILLASSNSVYAEEILKLDVQLKKLEFKSGEPIELTYTIKNNSTNLAERISTKPFAYFPDLISIKGPDGSTLVSTLNHPHVSRRDNGDFLLLPPQSFFGLNFDLQKQFPPAYLKNPHSLLPPGNYEIRVTYKSMPNVSDTKAPLVVKSLDYEQQKSWAGVLTALPITINVLEPSKAEVEELKKKLQGDNTVEKVKAIAQVGTMRLRTLLPLVEDILESNSDIKAQQSALVVLNDMEQPASLDVYLRTMQSEDVIVKTESFLGIRSLWKQAQLRPRITQEAVPYLIKSAEPTKYPDSYIGALGTLGFIKDPRALNVAQKISEDQKLDGEIRYIAKNLVVELQNLAK